MTLIEGIFLKLLISPEIDFPDSFFYNLGTKIFLAEAEIFSKIDIILFYLFFYTSDSNKYLIFTWVLVKFGYEKDTMTFLKKCVNWDSSIQTHIWLWEL